jgi:hypothetical protein
MTKTVTISYEVRGGEFASSTPEQVLRTYFAIQQQCRTFPTEGSYYLGNDTTTPRIVVVAVGDLPVPEAE